MKKVIGTFILGRVSSGILAKPLGLNVSLQVSLVSAMHVTAVGSQLAEMPVAVSVLAVRKPQDSCM